MGFATLALAATASADVAVETLPPAPPPVEVPAAAPPPVVAEEAPPEPPPPEAPPPEAPPATEVLPEPPPAAAAPPPPEVTTAAAPPATAEPRARVAGAPPEPVEAGVGSGETEPDCVVTAPDGSCALDSTECDILGDDGDNELFGTPEGEVICGLGGDDLLDGRGGDDMLVGGPGADRFSGDAEVCVIPDDEDVEPLRLRRCVFNNGRYFNVAPPPTDTEPPPSGNGGAPGGAGDVASVGTLYVALTRYAGAQEATEPGGAIAVVAERAVNYSDGEIRFLVRCLRAGAVRVTLVALAQDGRRVRLGATTFSCAGEGDDPVVGVELSEEGRRLVERSARVRIQAQVAESGAAGASNASRQTFVLTP